MNRNRTPIGPGHRTGIAEREAGELAGESFDFEVVPSRRKQRPGKPQRARRVASDDGDLLRAVWEVTER